MKIGRITSWRFRVLRDGRLIYSLFSNLQVTEEMAMEYVSQNDNMPWMETSAKLDENIDHLFMVLASLLKDRADLERARATCDGETLPSSISGNFNTLFQINPSYP